MYCLNNFVLLQKVHLIYVYLHIIVIAHLDDFSLDVVGIGLPLHPPFDL